MIALLPLLLAAAPVAYDAPAVRTQVRTQVRRVAVATVTIIQAEPVEVTPISSAEGKTDRQYRRRDSVPMVEFY